jgi:hypothetical protein
VLLAYVDESGDTGDVSKGGSDAYALGCVLVDADHWPESFDQLLEFRKRLRDSMYVPIRAEIKASSLIRNSGDLRLVGLGRAARRVIFRAHMRILRELPARAFAIVVDKETGRRDPAECFDLAWEAMLQRLARTSREESATFSIVHDEGEDLAIRKMVRRARRFLTAGSAFGYGSLRVDARLLVDDPTPRRSSQSSFVQLADLVAYCALRSVKPPKRAPASVCPQTMWTEIGPATHTAVTRLKPRAAPGIVLRK